MSSQRAERSSRQGDAFRDWVKKDGSTPYGPEPDRYHLYVSLACPWAHRTIILRQSKGLEKVIGMTVVIRCATNAVGPFALVRVIRLIRSTGSSS